MKTVFGKLILVFCLVIACGTNILTFAQTETAVDDFVQKQLTAQNLPGASVAVVRDGKVLLAKGFGLANVETKTPATAETVYEIASLTKQFTAAAVMLLVEEGKVNLDAPAAKYLENLPEKWRAVTVRQLLNHTSGIKNYTAIATLDPKKEYAPKELLETVAAEPLEFAPGAAWTYSNTNYFLLGLLIEKVSGKTYGEFLRKRIFEPLGMRDSRFNDRRENIKFRAAGYKFENAAFTPVELVSPQRSYAAGALLSTVADLAKWDAALNSEKLLKRASLEQMWTPAKLPDGKTARYGFGWGVSRYRGLDLVGHSGAIAGFSSNITRFIADKLTVIVLVNGNGTGAEKIALGVAEIYLPALKQNAPPPTQNISDMDEKTTAFLREVIEKIAAGQADRKWFTEHAQNFFFPDRIAQIEGILSKQGAIKSFELVEDEKLDVARRRSYRLSFENLKIRFTFVLNNENKIDGITLRPE